MIVSVQIALVHSKYCACSLGFAGDTCPHPLSRMHSGCQEVHPSVPAPVVFRCRSLRRAGRSLQSCFLNCLLSPRCSDPLCPSRAMGLWNMGRDGASVPGRVGGETQCLGCTGAESIPSCSWQSCGPLRPVVTLCQSKVRRSRGSDRSVSTVDSRQN